MSVLTSCPSWLCYVLTTTTPLILGLFAGPCSMFPDSLRRSMNLLRNMTTCGGWTLVGSTLTPLVLRLPRNVSWCCFLWLT